MPPGLQGLPSVSPHRGTIEHPSRAQPCLFSALPASRVAPATGHGRLATFPAHVRCPSRLSGLLQPQLKPPRSRAASSCRLGPFHGRGDASPIRLGSPWDRGCFSPQMQAFLG